MVQEEPLAFLVDSISDALLVRSLDGTVLLANTLAVELHLSERSFSAYEEFERSGERFVVRGLQLRSREGELSFTLVARTRR